MHEITGNQYSRLVWAKTRSFYVYWQWSNYVIQCTGRYMVYLFNKTFISVQSQGPNFPVQGLSGTKSIWLMPHGLHHVTFVLSFWTLFLTKSEQSFIQFIHQIVLWIITFLPAWLFMQYLTVWEHKIQTKFKFLTTKLSSPKQWTPQLCISSHKIVLTTHHK